MDLNATINELLDRVPDAAAKEELARTRGSGISAPSASIPDPLLPILWPQDTSESFVNGFEPVSAKGMVSLKRGLDGLLADGTFEVDPEEPEWWSELWWPIADDGAGQYLCWDSMTGDVIEFLHDDPLREVLAPSLEEFFSKLLDDVRSGAAGWRRHYGWVTAELSARLDEYAASKPSRRTQEIDTTRGLITLALFVIVFVVLVAVQC